VNSIAKKLLAKTLDEKFSHTWTEMTYEDLQKFADHFVKLLVNECADTAYKFDGLTLGQGYTTAKHIRKHFGIEQ
jgi:hypothetical protein